LAFKTEELLSLELLACWEFCLGQFQSILKGNFNMLCITALVEGGAEGELYQLILGSSREA